jgi:Protein of unknown function (DUF2971)
MPFFYRFRSIDALLGDRQELGKQEIYFCPPEQLNDPMEGFKDLFWKGDEIVWRNLMKHYLLCLTHTVVMAMVAGKDYKPIISRGFVFSTSLSMPTDQFKAIYDRIYTVFFSNADLEKVPSLLATSTGAIRREELEFCLRALHPFAFNAIVETFREQGLTPPFSQSMPEKIAGVPVIEGLLRVLGTMNEANERVDPHARRRLFTTAGRISQQLAFIRYVKDGRELSRAWHSILYAFPEQYVDSLSDLVYFDWYAACFVANPDRIAMWAHYGEAHKGVCLKFRAETEEHAAVVRMRGIVGWHGSRQGSGPSHGEVVLPFTRMTYADRLAEVDFFRSIGRLPIPALKAGWYTDSNGRESECARTVLSQSEEWLQSYWAAFRSLTSTKLEEWKNEDEYRLVLMTTLGLYQNPEDRKLTYQFSSLEGIIFGIRTSLEDKARIASVIAEKCKQHGRKSFELSQATYVPHTGKIEVHGLDLLRFE